MWCMWTLRSNRTLAFLPLSRTRRSHTFNREFSVGTTFHTPKDARLDNTKVTRPPHQLQTLAIETSCDDTSVAVLTISAHADSHELQTEVIFHEKITADTEAFKGIHPLLAFQSHQTELASLVQTAVKHLQPKHSIPSWSNASNHNNDTDRVLQQCIRAPDFVTVTRGPGMRSNLSVGLDTAKGLATAWNVPLLGVHHMQAHALTPRLCYTLQLSNGREPVLHHRDMREGYERIRWRPADIEPKFPFLTILASGGHTMLINSQSLNEHKILAETNDIALGDCLDKAARAILPESELKSPYGKALEEFAFPTKDYSYRAPVNRGEELETRSSRWGWSLRPPLADSKSGEKTSRRMIYSFSGLFTSVQRHMTRRDSEGGSHLNDSCSVGGPSLDERRDLAREVQRVAFEHLGSRVLLYLTSLPASQRKDIRTVVVSGGVAANGFLRHVLRSMLDARGYHDIELSFPPVALCTDNALMIAWAGMEMYKAGFESALSIGPLKKWSMDPSASDGGILGVAGWQFSSGRHLWNANERNVDEGG